MLPGKAPDYINNTDHMVKQAQCEYVYSCPIRRDKVKSHHSGVYSVFGRRILSDNPR